MTTTWVLSDSSDDDLPSVLPRMTVASKLIVGSIAPDASDLNTEKGGSLMATENIPSLARDVFSSSSSRCSDPSYRGVNNHLHDTGAEHYRFAEEYMKIQPSNSYQVS